MKPTKLKQSADPDLRYVVGVSGDGTTYSVDSFKKVGVPDKQIVKVQLPVGEDATTCFVYNKGRSLIGHFVLTADVRLAVGNHAKAYFEADLREFNETRQIALLARTKPQDW